MLAGITILVGVALDVEVVDTVPGLGAKGRRVVGCICIVDFGSWTFTSWLGVVDDTADVTERKLKNCKSLENIGYQLMYYPVEYDCFV